MRQIIHRVQDEIISSSQNTSASCKQWFISVPCAERFLNRHEVFFGFASPRVRAGKTMERDVPAREDGGRGLAGSGGQRGDCENKSGLYRRGDVSRSIVSTLTPSLSHFFLGYRSALASFDRIRSTLFAPFSATLAANRVWSLPVRTIGMHKWNARKRIYI